MPDIQIQSSQPTLLATFFVREALCGLDASSVQEVIRLGAITVAPHAPADVAGIINLRGRIVTIVDAAMKLGYGRTETGADTRVFIVEDHNEFLGLLVDRVGEVVEVERGAEEPLPANMKPDQARYFKGVSRAGGRLIALLNPGGILTAGIEPARGQS
jgi:purine-binding chemotaxis protein CheW